MEDKCLALQLAGKELMKAAPKFYQPLQHREDYNLSRSKIQLIVIAVVLLIGLFRS